MDALSLARWQFGLTATFHFFLVPLTLGLSILVALMETLYVRTGDELYLRMTKFWGKLFVINFAVGVVTGIVLEFQFGMNWAEYSRFMGDIFGAPLAIEALLAFFLEFDFPGCVDLRLGPSIQARSRVVNLAGGFGVQSVRPVDPDRQLIHAGTRGLCPSQRSG